MKSLDSWVHPRMFAVALCFAAAPFAFAQTPVASPTGQAPATQQPPAAGTAARPPVQPKEVKEHIDDMLSISMYYWKPSHASPGFYGGKLSTDPTLQRLDLPNSPNHGTGIVVTFPTGGPNNRLEIAGFGVSDRGSVRPTKNLAIAGANLKAGELVNTQFKLKSYRITWNYLTFPVPAFGASFRVKTLWEFQYTSIRPTLSFPESTKNAADLNPNMSVKYPGAGVGFEYVPTRRFRAEGRFTGMAFPGRSRYWDSEINVVGRVHKVELYGGFKAFQFKTSPKKDLYLKGTVWGPLLGVRYVFGGSSK